MILSIDDFFKILNFGVRLAIALYLIKRYAVPVIAQVLSKQAHDKKAFAVAHGKLLVQCQDAQNCMDRDEHFFESMQQRFNIWNHAVAMQMQSERKTCMMREQEYEKIMQVCRRNIERRRLLKEQAPDILEQASKKLQDDFARNPEKAEQYVTSILMVLDK